jgi:hypothetical protein
MLAKVAAVGFVFLGSAGFAGEAPKGKAFPAETTVSELREGIWDVTRSHRIRFGFDSRVVKLEKRGDAWRITQFELRGRPDRARKKQVLTAVKHGPFPVTLKNGLLRIERPEGTVKGTFRFHGKLLQFPVVIRPDARTFRFTYSYVAEDETTKKRAVKTFSKTWLCDADPSKVRKGTATITAVSPEGTKKLRVPFRVGSENDGPSLAFRRTANAKTSTDLIVWTTQGYGFLLYRDQIEGTDPVILQQTYSPLSKRIRKLLVDRGYLKP